MTSSNGNIFRVTGPLCGEFTGPGEFPTQRPVTRSFDVFFDLRLNTRLSINNREAGDLRRYIALIMTSVLWQNCPYVYNKKLMSLSGVPDYFYRNKISSGGDLSHYSSASLY